MPSDSKSLERRPDTGPAIRRARRDDIPAVIAMVDRLAAHHGDVSSLDAAVLARDAFGTRPWIGVLVAEQAGSPIGYAMYFPWYSAQFGRRGMELHHLYVDPAFRGRGVGRRLIDAVVSRARRRGCGYVGIGTAPDNAAAQGYYQRLGFEPASPPGPRFRMNLG